MRLTLVCGKLIHDSDGSVTIESTPDSRDPASAWFLSMGGYDSSTQHPLWEDPLVKEYITYTESELVTRPMCAAGSPYRAFRTLCMNKKAIAGSVEYRALACTHRSHAQMRGRDANGVWHGEHAERYTAEWCGVLDRIHQTAWEAFMDTDGGDESGKDSDGDSGSDSSASDAGDADSDSDSDSGSGSDSEDEKTDSDESTHQQQQPQQQLRQQAAIQPAQQMAQKRLTASVAEPLLEGALGATPTSYSETSRGMNSKIVVSPPFPKTSKA
jgi:hypothetical protein